MKDQEQRKDYQDGSHWCKRQEIPDPQILDAARQYEEAFKALKMLPPGSGVLLPLINLGAITVELYLKSLTAEKIYIKDDLMTEAATIFAKPTKGHCLVNLLDTIPTDTQNKLIQEFNDELFDKWNQDLRAILQQLEGEFTASRYSFEHRNRIDGDKLKYFVGLIEFFSLFAKTLPSRETISFKNN